ncbi:hypothetical protein J437_LFUL000746 [Ladona fulva]|uniref:PiggyBac transposable element-derived protein domain-containing protein n=1 Tax=Ladona fulva TaxID=123851 RepID=A0A8K0PCZ8_LADFU|nr:hypothetical protein J437_LFUL000746 [Ladona fulva]
MSEHQSTINGEKRDRKRKLSPPRSFPVEEIQHMLQDYFSDDDFVVLTEEETDESDYEDVEVVTLPDAALQSGSVVQLVDQLEPNAREQDVGSTNTAKWKDLPSSRTNIRFDGPFGMKTPPSEETPFAYFLLLFSDNFFVFIVKQTDDYAKHVLSQNILSHSRISLWKETTIAEMKEFIGEQFLMGIIRQFISTKRHKYGMKLYVIAEPNGLVQKIHLYGGSKDEEVGDEKIHSKS